MPAIALVMGKKEGCNKMGLKTHFVTAPDKRNLIEKERTSPWYNDSGLATTSLYVKEVRCQ